MKRWIIGIIAGYFLLALAMCYAQYRPILIENDTDQRAKIDITNTLLDKVGGLYSVEPRGGFRDSDCSRSYKLIFLSTQANPDMVAYRMKDICDPDDCSCEIKISQLEKRRRDLSVPWQMAGTILRPSFKR